MSVIVNIIEIKDPEPVFVGESIGYSVKFDCSLVNGVAILIGENPQVGNSFSVETGYKSVSNFRALDARHTDTIRTGNNPGDYFIVGTVKYQDEHLVSVYVSNLRFDLDPLEIGRIVLEPGQSVEFELQGLSLWDENI